MAELPYMTLADLTVIFGYKDEKQTRKALDRGTLDIPTYKIRGRIVVDPAVLRAWFAIRRDQGLAKLAEESSPQ